MNMPIRPNRLRECLRAGKPTMGTRIENPWAYMTEIAASSGYFDYIEYEGEYAPHTEEELENICRAAELYGCSTVVKVDRQNYPFMMQKAIACGASGILLADVYNADEVKEFMNLITTSYPGGGIFGRPNRRLGMNGTGRMRMSDYRKMTDDVVKLIMIEKEDALKNLDEICQVPGVDMLVYGPFDYATNVGWEMDTNADDLMEVHKKIIATGLKYGVRTMVQLDDNSKVPFFYDLGVRDFNIGDEMQMHINYYSAQAPEIAKILGK